ncbi:PAS domain S-box protein [Ectobacillus ponti]|uniref:histidine kinase n=1 Tax=Ectobacillus ponti TaxID=2961894 RepID=A0AA41X980_9BACI|nr:PAS domain S-box protein [Ectobacillus ponti]MCP8967696.1 PAS domain S-box protein [Ectobacillus ponti]
MLQALLVNVAIILVPPLIITVILMSERCRQNGMRMKLLTGFIYGCAAIGCMMHPFVSGADFLWDLRWVPFLVVLLYSGPAGGMVCLFMLAGYRFFLGTGLAAYMTLADGLLLLLASCAVSPGFRRQSRSAKAIWGLWLSLILYAFVMISIGTYFAVTGQLAFLFKQSIWLYIGMATCYAVSVTASILPIENLREVQLLRRLWNVSEKNYRILAENSADMLCRISADGYILYVSPACKRLLGYEPHELTGRKVSSLLHPEELDMVRGSFWTTGVAEEVFTFRMRKKDGSYNWFETVGSKHEGRQLITVPRDITERVQREEELRRSAQLLASAQEITNIGSFEWELGHDTFTHSQQNLHIFGRESGSISSFPAVLASLHPDDRPKLNQAVSTAIRCGIYETEYRVIRPHTGEVRHVRSRGKIIYDGKGQARRLVGTNQDVTEQKQMELQIQESEERYRRIVESSPNAIFIFRENEIVYANETGRRLLRVPYASIMQMSLPDLLGDAGAQAMHEAARKQRTDGVALPVEVQLQRLGGDACIVEARALSVVYRGEPALYVLLTDITERKRSQELLQQSEKLKLVGELAAGIAHEIRNPLTSLKGFVQLFGYDKQQGQAEYIHIMLSEIDRINDIVGELLLLAKPNKSDFARKNLCSILHDVITLLQPQANMDNIRILNYCEGGSIPVYCVENKLKQVCLNVLKNAMEAMPEGGNISVFCTEEEGRVKIRFQDEGCGIPQEYLPKVGQVFFTTKEKGTGLGTMISYSIVDNHKGEMRFASEVGKGTTVDIFLPLASPAARETVQ